MTIQDKITELENAGAVEVYHGESRGRKNNDEEVAWTLHRIYYKIPISDNVNSKMKMAELSETVVGEESVFKYLNDLPEILKDIPEPTPPRPFHYDDATIKTGLEAENPGWEVIQIRKRRDGVLDEVTVDYSDGTNKLQTVYVVWEREDGTKDYKEKA